MKFSWFQCFGQPFCVVVVLGAVLMQGQHIDWLFRYAKHSAMRWVRFTTSSHKATQCFSRLSVGVLCAESLHERWLMCRYVIGVKSVDDRHVVFFISVILR